MGDGKVGPALSSTVANAVVVVELQWSLLLIIYQSDFHSFHFVSIIHLEG
jgi:hypothetical protein